MAEELSDRVEAGKANEPPHQRGADDTAPPPLLAIRVRGAAPRGLNKPAIIAVAAGALGVVLVLASSGLSTSKAKRPADAKPMMGDPARPEMAQSIIQKLPATYDQAPALRSSGLPASVPILGPPLPGDIAAFAPIAIAQNQTIHPSGGASSELGTPTTPGTSRAPDEAQTAQRSGLFFQLREAPRVSEANASLAAPTRSPLAAIGPAPAWPAIDAADRSLHPGSVISASLVTALNSEAPGPVIAQVTQPVYDSLTGHTLLIPQAAKLIGDYKSTARYGQSRIAILWSRLILPSGQEIKLDEVALDPAGAAGAPGQVDNHWSEVFGAAALGSLINVGVATTEDRPSLGVSLGGVGFASNEDPTDAAIREGVQRSASQVSSRVVDRSLAVPPTIRAQAGTRITVIVTRRLAL